MQNTNTKQLVAVKDFEDQLCGQMVFWSLSGFMDYEKFVEAWSDAGLPTELCPVLPEDSAALRYAMHRITAGAVRARKVEKAWAVVTESISGKNYRTAQDWTVTLQKDGTLLFDWVSSRVIDPQDHALKLKIQGWYAKYRTAYSVQVISSWLTNLSNGFVRHLDATTMRDRGGLYFIPANRVKTWNKVVKILRDNSNHVMHNIPALFTDEVVESVMHSVQRELDSTVEDVEHAFNEKDLGERALETQLIKLAEARSKAERYQKLLGTKIEDLKDKGREIKVQIGTAIMLKRAEKDKKDAAKNGKAA